MQDIKIIKETSINMFQLKEELEKIKKRDNELNIRVNKTYEYLSQFASFKKAKELEEKLVKLNIPRLKEQHIHKVIDILPTSVKDLRVILQGYTLTLNNENMKKIVDTINEFLEKK